MTLQVPDFVGRGLPQASVTVAEPPGVLGSSSMQIQIDVDVHHDGKFTDAGDADFGSGTINGSGMITFTRGRLRGLIRRARRPWTVMRTSVSALKRR